MRKNILVTVLFVAALLVQGPAVNADEIVIVGTGSGMSILSAIGGEYSKKNPGIDVVVPKSIGSGGGIKAVGTGEFKIGRVARSIKDREKHYNLEYVPFLKLPVVFFINKSVGVKNLTAQQVCDIYSGKTRNWSDVGGKDCTINVVRREDGDSSFSVLRNSFPGFKDISITERSKTAYSDIETCKIVEKIENTIAFGTYDNAKNFSVDIVKINGISPTDNNYPYFSPLAFVYKKQNYKGSVKGLVDFAKSREVENIINDMGAVQY